VDIFFKQGSDSKGQPGSLPAQGILKSGFLKPPAAEAGKTESSFYNPMIFNL
jgi:hypothetical protein